MQTISRRFTAEKTNFVFDEEITDGRSLQANRTVRCDEKSFAGPEDGNEEKSVR